MKIIWIDIETTGLDPNCDRILEIEAMEADFNEPFTARHLYHATMPYVNDGFLSTNILEMHTKNGLLSACAGPLTKRRALVDIELRKSIDAIEEPDVFPFLGGSSINFDWNFIRVKFPQVAERMSHRPGDVKRYDVSVLKNFCESMGMPPIAKGEAHRARADIIDSIKQGIACDEWLKQRKTS